MAHSATDTRILFATRLTRLFAYGFLSVVLALYLAQIGLSEQEIGLLLTLTLLGDAVISLWLTTSADRIGRRRMLLLGAALMVLAGAVFVLTKNFAMLLIAAIVGVISPSGNEIGPFLSIEQAALSQLIPNERRTKVFAWYNLVGSFATALGALSGGGLMQVLQSSGATALDSYRAVLIGYAVLGVALIAVFTRLSPAIETGVAAGIAPSHRMFGLHRSRGVVMKLSGLFALDAFAGGFVVQSLMAYWFHVKFGVAPATLGSIFFGANILAGLSALLAARIAARIGLINTMVFTHIPSNILLMLVPLMPSLALAIAVLLVRFSISQMDVPTRQSYTMAVVSPDERSAASGVTSIARSVGASLSPALSGQLLAMPTLLSVPFFFAGGLKIIYDLLLYRSFRALKPPEEEPRQ
ncbi:MFS transporter [candidate division KSB1 bacterium]|nr:MFS transporter [candidate division KSB1 bacterium]